MCVCVCVCVCVRACVCVCVCVYTWKVIKKGFPPTSPLIDVASRMVTLMSKFNFISDLGMELANKSGRCSLYSGQPQNQKNGQHRK